MTHAMTPNSIHSTASPDTTQYQVGGLLAAEVVSMIVSLVCCCEQILRCSDCDRVAGYEANSGLSRRHGALVRSRVRRRHGRAVEALILRDVQVREEQAACDRGYQPRMMRNA